MHRRGLALLLAAGCLLPCCACGTAELAETGSAQSLQSLEQPYIGIVLQSQDGQYYPLIKAGAEAEASRVGAEVIVVSPDDANDAEEQERLVDIMADMALDVLAVSACDESVLDGVLQQAQNNGKIVLAVDEELSFSGCAAYIGSDNTGGGRWEGAYAATAAQGDAAIILRGAVDSSNHTERTTGLRSGLYDGGVAVAACRDCGCSRSASYAETISLLESRQDIGVICTTNDDMALGAYQAVRSRQASIPIVSFDGTPEVLELVKEGKISGAIVQNAYEIGVQSVDAAVAAYHGETVDDVIVPAQLVTQRTAQTYLDQLERRLQNDEIKE